MHSVTTDYAGVADEWPEPYLRMIAESPFRQIHWCHEWSTDYLYDNKTMRRLVQLLRDLELELVDLHASHGQSDHYYAIEEEDRKRGVALLENRLELLARAGGGVAVLHPPILPERHGDALWDACRRGIDAVEPMLRRENIRLAFENLVRPESWDVIDRLCCEYGAEVVGLCYDSGHGNLFSEGLDRFAALSHRLLALHLHDNDGEADLHLPLFEGTIDWLALAGFIAASPYTGPLTQEGNMGNVDACGEERFLAEAYARGERLAGLLVDKPLVASPEPSAEAAVSKPTRIEVPSEPAGLILDPTAIASLLPPDFDPNPSIDTPGAQT